MLRRSRRSGPLADRSFRLSRSGSPRAAWTAIALFVFAVPAAAIGATTPDDSQVRVIPGQPPAPSAATSPSPIPGLDSAPARVQAPSPSQRPAPRAPLQGPPTEGFGRLSAPSASGPAQNAPGSLTGPETPADLEGHPDRARADTLYMMASADARTFQAALTRSEVRSEVERVFGGKLSDRQLRVLADKSKAEADYWYRYIASLDQKAAEAEGQRLIPGRAPEIERPAPIDNPSALPPPEAVANDEYLPLPDRWRIVDALGRPERLLDPYNPNTLKGDKPIFGRDYFLNLMALSDTLFEPSRVPVGVGTQSTARPGSNNTFGRYGRSLTSQTALLSLSLIKGDTAFKPPDFELRMTPVFNFNYTRVGELGVINADPRKGQDRSDSFLALQEGFVDYHLRNVSEYFDFDSVRVGIQPFSSDFRGFLFQDNQLGVRIFGDRGANLWQYNLAYFRRLEKDTNSGLNDISRLRRDAVYVANVYHQDFPVQGFTSQLTFLRNENREAGELKYDSNNFIISPAQIGDGRGYNYDVNYAGFNGDGHFGRLNLTTSAYYAFGHQTHNQFSAVPNQGRSISAFFAAAEPSIDFDFYRIRASALYGSGDNNPRGSHAHGFDAIFENPQFAGADTSYWIRQSLPFIGGGGVALNTENGVLADLRSSKGEGQSNFTNPGIMLVGLGGDVDILPELRLSTNFNYLRFATTAPLQLLRNQANIPDSIGHDLSMALTYRPLLSQNVVLRLSGAMLIPGRGLKAIYNTQGSETLFSNGNFLYSVLASATFTY